MKDIWEDAKSRSYILRHPLLFPDVVLRQPTAFKKATITKAAKAVLNSAIFELHPIAATHLKNKEPDPPAEICFGLIVEASEYETYRQISGTMERDLREYGHEQFDLPEPRICTRLDAIETLLNVRSDSEILWPDEPWDPGLDTYMETLGQLTDSRKALYSA